MASVQSGQFIALGPCRSDWSSSRRLFPAHPPTALHTDFAYSANKAQEETTLSIFISRSKVVSTFFLEDGRIWHFLPRVCAFYQIDQARLLPQASHPLEAVAQITIQDDHVKVAQS